MDATEREQLGQWLRAKRNESSLAKIAERYGCAKSTWQRYESGEREVPVELLQRLYNHYADLPKFAVATLPKAGSENYRVEEPIAAFGGSRDADFVDVPLYDVSASAGGGAWSERQQIKTYLKFRRDWLMWTCGATRGLFLVTVHGDSMLPTITDGSVVLMRELLTWNLSAGVYLLMIDGRICVKRLDAPQLEGVPGTSSTRLRALVVSDNAKGQKPREIVFSDENSADNTVIARAVWAGNKLG